MISNLSLGILYAWSVWKVALVNKAEADLGHVMTGINQGWPYLTDAQGTLAYAIAGLLMTFTVLPGGRFMGKFGPKVGITVGGLLVALGCFVAGLTKSYCGLVIGFGIFCGWGMGFGYAVGTPVALKWFGPHKRGLIAGLVVAAFGGAALYIAPLAHYLITHFGLSTSFISLGIMILVVAMVAAQFVSNPPVDYVPPAPPVSATAEIKQAAATADWTSKGMLSRWQCYALIFLQFSSAQAGLYVIANAVPILASTAKGVEFLAANIWIIAIVTALGSTLGRAGSGWYSDKMGRSKAYALNATISLLCLLALPTIIEMKSIPLLFLAIFIPCWQYGGGQAMLPVFTADFFGAKFLHSNYGFVFMGGGICNLYSWGAGHLKDVTGSYSIGFYISAVILFVAACVSLLTKKPVKAGVSNS
jgi:MFS family permease